MSECNDKIVCQILCYSDLNGRIYTADDFMPGLSGDASGYLKRTIAQFLCCVCVKEHYPINISGAPSVEKARSIVFSRDVKAGYDTYLISLTDDISVNIGDSVMIGDYTHCTVSSVYVGEHNNIEEYVSSEKKRLNEKYRDEIDRMLADYKIAELKAEITVPFSVAKDTICDKVDDIKNSVENVKKKFTGFFK